MSIKTTEVTAENHNVSHTVDAPAAKRTEFNVLVEPDLANGTIISVQVKPFSDATWRTIDLIAAATVTAGEFYEYGKSLAGPWHVRAICTTFVAGDSPAIYLAVENQ